MAMDAGGCRCFDGDSLFVIKPPNWTTPIGAGGIPRFSYLHQPHGTPAILPLAPRGVAPTGPLPASIDFPLQRQPENASFEALLLADPQPENDGELAYLRDDIIAATLPIGAAFAIVHGDVVADDLSLYPRYLRLLAATGIPWHHCPGNHDMNSDAQGRSHFARDVEARLRPAPLRLSVCGRHVPRARQRPLPRPQPRAAAERHLLRAHRRGAARLRAQRAGAGAAR